MNIDIITDKIALDSSRIVAVNQGDLTIHLTGGIVLHAAEDTIREVIKSIRPRQTDQRRAHAPQLAGPEVAHRVKVVVTENHRKEPASWGCHVAACSASADLVKLLISAAVIVLVNKIQLVSDRISALLIALPLTSLIAMIWMHQGGQSPNASPTTPKAPSGSCSPPCRCS
jgi:hypothetical protein